MLHPKSPHNKAINSSGERAELIAPAALRRRVIAVVLRIFRKEVLVSFLPPLVANPVYAERFVFVFDPEKTKRLSLRVP
jgi:hypothetical protein